MDWRINKAPITGPEWGKRNLVQYDGVPPSIELIRSILKRSKIKFANRFERIFALPEATLKKYLLGMRDLPPRYWHLFYEFDNLKKEYKSASKKQEKKDNLKQVTESNKAIINTLKAKLNVNS